MACRRKNERVDLYFHETNDIKILHNWGIFPKWL